MMLCTPARKHRSYKIAIAEEAWRLQSAGKKVAGPTLRAAAEKAVGVRWADEEALRRINVLLTPHAASEVLPTKENVEAIRKLCTMLSPQWAIVASRWLFNFWTTSRRLHDQKGQVLLGMPERGRCVALSCAASCSEEP